MAMTKEDLDKGVVESLQEITEAINLEHSGLDRGTPFTEAAVNILVKRVAYLEARFKNILDIQEDTVSNVDELLDCIRNAARG